MEAFGLECIAGPSSELIVDTGTRFGRMRHPDSLGPGVARSEHMDLYLV